MTSATVNPDCGTPPSPAPRRIAQLEFRQDAARGVFVDDDLSAAMGAGDTVALLRLADPDKRHLSTALAGERQLLEKHLMHLRHYQGRCCRGPAQNGPRLRIIPPARATDRWRRARAG